MMDTHTQGANFALMGLGMERGEESLAGSLFEWIEPAGAGWEEKAGGWFQQQMSASPHHSRPEGKTAEMLVGSWGRSVVGGKQAGTEYRGARGMLPLT